MCDAVNGPKTQLTISNAINFPTTLEAALSTLISPGDIPLSSARAFRAASALVITPLKVFFPEGVVSFAFHPDWIVADRLCEAVLTACIRITRGFPEAFCFPLSTVAIGFETWSWEANWAASSSELVFGVFLRVANLDLLVNGWLIPAVLDVDATLVAGVVRRGGNSRVWYLWLSAEWSESVVEIRRVLTRDRPCQIHHWRKSKDEYPASDCT